MHYQFLLRYILRYTVNPCLINLLDAKHNQARGPGGTQSHWAPGQQPAESQRGRCRHGRERLSGSHTAAVGFGHTCKQARKCVQVGPYFDKITSTKILREVSTGAGGDSGGCLIGGRTAVPFFYLYLRVRGASRGESDREK